MPGTPKKRAMKETLEAHGPSVLQDLVTMSQRAVAEKYGVTRGGLIFWLRDKRKQYDQAMEARADYFAQQMDEIADAEPERHPITGAIDPGDIANRRLKFDILKWRAGRMDPRRYGDKVEVEHSGQVGLVAFVQQFAPGQQRLVQAEPRQTIEGAVVSPTPSLIPANAADDESDWFLGDDDE